MKRTKYKMPDFIKEALLIKRLTEEMRGKLEEDLPKKIGKPNPKARTILIPEDLSGAQLKRYRKHLPLRRTK